jgi:hypothetical protein
VDDVTTGCQNKPWGLSRRPGASVAALGAPRNLLLSLGRLGRAWIRKHEEFGQPKTTSFYAHHLPMPLQPSTAFQHLGMYDLEMIQDSSRG